jgi:THO complex subunit 1
MGFEARYVLIKTSTPEALEQRLKASGEEDSAVQEILKRLPTELEPGKVDELFDTSIVDDNEEAAVKTLGDYIYGKSETEPAGEQSSEEDTAMKEGDEANAEDAETREATMTDA